MMMRINDRRGLIMVEVALAMVVLAVGVLAVFILFSTGLDTQTKASSDTQAALFAESVFNTLRAESALASEATNGWEDFWGEFAQGDRSVAVAAEGVWAGPGMVIGAHGVLYTNVYTNYSIRLHIETNIVDHALRYQMNVAPDFPTNRAEVTLRVWEGVFGPTNGNDTAVFYTEFDDPGNL